MYWTEQEAFELMMYGIIGAIVVILIILISGFIIRKQYYKEIDKLEAWKIDLMNRPVSDELGKVKQLNMTGETEEMFERWRKSWDDILESDLPNVEEKLFEIEEQTDKYMFRKAKAIQAGTEAILNRVEDKIQTILTELDELVSSEQENRVEIDELRTIFKEIKKKLLTHRHTYGKAIKPLDQRADALALEFNQYEELTQNGNYLGARNLVMELKKEIEILHEKVQKIPDLLTETGSLLPTQIAELVEGYEEMIEQGFVLDHLQFNEEMEDIKNTLKEYHDRLEKAELSDVEKGIGELKERMETIYDLLEKEVYAKNYVFQNTATTEQLLETIKSTNENIKDETFSVQQSYQLLEEEMTIPLELEQQIEKLMKRYNLLKAKIPEQQTIYSVLSEQLKEIRSQIEKIQQEQETFTEHLQSLRKDEISARDQVAELKRNIHDLRRLVKQSNIPGLPDRYQELFEQAQEHIQDTLRSLNAKPLNTEVVNQHLQQAVSTVDHLQQTTYELVDSVVLAEKVIQYGNRYRGKYQKVADGLQRAEAAFRSYDYQAALEEAAATVESVEPGALKRIEQTYVKQD